MEFEKSLTAEERAGIEKMAAHDLEQVKVWTATLKHAEEQLKYWKNQSDHSSVMAIRLKISQW
jgi:hypothetical protein